MSTIPAELPGAKGTSTVSVLGHRVSADALLLAAASLVGIFVLWRASKPSQSAPAPAPAVDPGNLASPPAGSMIASSPAPAAEPSQPWMPGMPGGFANPIAGDGTTQRPLFGRQGPTGRGLVFGSTDVHM